MRGDADYKYLIISVLRTNYKALYRPLSNVGDDVNFNQRVARHAGH